MEHTVLAIALFNRDTRPELIDEEAAIVMVTHGQPLEKSTTGLAGDRRPVQYISREAIQRVAHPHTLKFRKITDQQLEFVIDPNTALSGGQIIIDCSTWLCNKLMAITLPEDHLLCNGLVTSLFRPRLTQPTFIEYYKPTPTEQAKLCIAVHDATPEGNNPQLISAAIGTNQKPTITNLDVMPSPSHQAQMFSTYQVEAISTATISTTMAATEVLVETFTAPSTSHQDA